MAREGAAGVAGPRVPAQAELLANILDHIPYFVFWKDRRSVFLGCNWLFAQAAGLKDPRDIAGKTDYDMPWSAEETEFHRYCDRQIIETGQPMLNIDETLRNADGSLSYIMTSKVPLRDTEGQVIGVLGIFADITERKQAEQALRTRIAAIDAAADMVVITDANGVIRYINPAFTATTGYTAQEAIGQTPRILRSSEQDAGFYAAMWRQVLAGQVWRGELINRRKDGTLYPEEMSITPVMGEDGRVARLVAIKRDITGRREREALEREREGLRRAMVAMDHVLGVVGHELRTPLAGLRAISEFLLTDGENVSEEARGLLTSMNSEVVRMSDTVNNLLEAARLNSGQATWQWGGFLLVDVCRDALETVRPLLNVDGVTMDLKVQPELVAMKGDADAIRRLVTNLLGNACKHTASGHIQVDVKSRTDVEGEWIEIQVADTGPGIPMAIAVRLGEPFALNAGVVGGNHVAGTGLGLAICKGIAAAHGGYLRVRSRENAGTTIAARLRADLAGPAELAAKVQLVAEIDGA